MNILVIDDDVAAAEGIRAIIPAEALHIDRVETVYNISDAKQLFLTEQMDILICDIEMPGGSGIELMEWINRQKNPVVCAFLTSHADFAYAQQAVKLGVLEYILKPVEEQTLIQILRKCIQRREEQMGISKAKDAVESLQKNRELIISRLLDRLRDGTIPDNPTALLAQAAKHHVAGFFQTVRCPVLLSAKNLSEENDSWNRPMLDYAAANIAREILCNDFSELVYRTAPLEFFVFPNKNEITPALVQKCTNACNTFLELNICCYVGEPTNASGFKASMEALLEMKLANVAQMNGIFYQHDQIKHEKSERSFDATAVTLLLEAGKTDDVYRLMSAFLDQLTERDTITREFLEQMVPDFTQLLYSFLASRNIQAHLLFADARSLSEHDHAASSVFNFKKYIHRMLALTAKQLAFVSDETSVIDQAIRYIDENLEQLSNREQVASHVFLNSDHLSRLIKKKNGMSLSQYIAYARLEKAKALLDTTSLSATDIAALVGYTHYTYFSTSFKKATGFSPADYRREHIKEESL